jgi:RNA polymerase sigma-70 factor (ECF subfamily)
MDETATETWDACYDRLAAKLVLYARQWLPHREDAEDAVHEAFVKVWKRRGRQHVSDAYFFAATRHAAIDHQRRTTRRGKREERLTRDPLFADTELPPALAAQDAEAALARLPFEQREAVVLRIWGGLGFPEIAEATGAPADTAASRYRYGIATLRKFFDLAPS